MAWPRGMAVLAALLAWHPPGALAQDICPAGAALEAKDTMRMAAHSPLYRLAKERLGPATGCRVSKDEDSETLVVSFGHGGAFTVTRSPAIELASQALSLGQPSKPVTRTEAVDTLRKTETEATGRDGCGISQAKWRSARDSRGDVELSGGACNCKATIQIKDRAVSGLGFSTAC